MKKYFPVRLDCLTGGNIMGGWKAGNLEKNPHIPTLGGVLTKGIGMMSSRKEISTFGRYASSLRKRKGKRKEGRVPPRHELDPHKLGKRRREAIGHVEDNRFAIR